MTFPLATSVNFPTPACLHSSCLYHPSVASPCRLLLAINIATHGHFVMELPSVPLNWSSWRVRFVRPIGRITKIHRSATFQPLGHTILAEKFPIRTRQFQHGWKQFSLTPSRRKQRANKALLWARCSEEPVNILGSRAEGNEKAQVHVAEKGVVKHVWEVHDCPQQSCGSPFHRIEMGWPQRI